jgi:hypothetical protein
MSVFFEVSIEAKVRAQVWIVRRSGLDVRREMAVGSIL